MLTNINVFDIYKGDKIDNNCVSIAYKLTFTDINKTLTDEEVMEVFNKIISSVTTKFNAKLRDN